MNRKYTRIRSVSDHRDKVYRLIKPVPEEVKLVDLTPLCPAIYDQGDLGSCTANAWAADYEFLLMKEKHFTFMPSRLYIYYYERIAMGVQYIKQDSGASLRDGAQVLNNIGVCSERVWPYWTAMFAVKPPFWCDKSASLHKAIKYESVAQDKETMKSVLYNEQIPIVAGINVYSSFESKQVAKTGHVPMPSSSDKALGGHAICVVGFDENNQQWICRNSWGTSWGMKGYFTLPYEYMLDPNLSDDFWAAQFVE